MIPLSPPAIYAPAKIDDDRLIRCIAETEGGSWSKPGGALCWTVAAWREETSSSYHYSNHRPSSVQAAKNRIDRHARYWVKVCGVMPSVADLAACWNLGLDGAIRHRLNRKTNDYANRVANLYNDPGFK